MAAKWAVASLSRGQPSLMSNYQTEWEAAFLKEMKTMTRLRGILEKLSNADLEAVLATMANPKLMRKLSSTDFDFHGTALLAALGVPGLIRIAKVVASAEVRSLLLQS